MKKHALDKKKGIWLMLAAAALLLAIGLAAAGFQMGREDVGGEGTSRPAEEAAPGEVVPEDTPEGEGSGGEPGPGTAAGGGEDGGQPGYIEKLMGMGVPIPDKEVDFEDLRENVNKDIYAWIYIPDSKIDYPVLQHPLDNLYYLNYNLDGSYGYPGCIYTENYNSMDFSDPLTVVYGHNMKNGTMFAGLHKYEDGEYFAEHPYVYVYTPEKLLVYRVFAAHEYGNGHLLYRRDYTEKETFEAYISDIQGVRGMNCNRAEGVEVTAGSRILVLSTCMADKPDRRYLVQGVLLDED